MAAHEIKVTEVKTITEKLRILKMCGPNGEKIPAPNHEARFWLGDGFEALLKVGEVATIEIEKKPAHNDPEKTEIWLKSVNGTTAPKGKGGGGGGARAYVPKTPAEIHGPAVAHIIAELGKSKTPEEIKPYILLYRSELSNFATATAGRQGAS